MSNGCWKSLSLMTCNHKVAVRSFLYISNDIFYSFGMLLHSIVCLFVLIFERHSREKRYNLTNVLFNDLHYVRKIKQYVHSYKTVKKLDI